MTPLFYEDSLGAKLAEKANEALDRVGSADDELVDDPAALEAAQAAANAVDPYAAYDKLAPDWVVVWGPERLGGQQLEIDQNATLLTMPLDAEGVSYAWSPCPPSESYPQRGVSVPFELLVSPHDAERARSLIGDLSGWMAASVRHDTGASVPARPNSAPRAVSARPGPPDDELQGQQHRGVALAVALLLFALLVAAVAYVAVTGAHFGLRHLFGQ